jgi:hypothetical protein
MTFKLGEALGSRLSPTKSMKVFFHPKVSLMVEGILLCEEVL